MIGARRRLSGAVAICAVASLSGCSLVTTLWGPPPGFLPRSERPRSPTGLYDFKGVVHCHSFRSHDSTGTIETIGAACQSVGMDFLVMTDHPAPYSVLRGRRGLVGDTLFLVGAELRVPGGTLLAFPLKHYVRPHQTLAEYLADIHGQGGLAIVGHAEQFTRWTEPGIDGVEVHNLHAAAVRAPKWWVICKALFTPLGTLFTSLVQPDPAVLANWDAMARFPMPAIGGTDAHANIRLLGSLGWVLGDYREVFRVASTHVLAARLESASLVDAIRRGRTYVVFDLWRDGSGFVFWAAEGGGVFEMGATVSSRATLHVRVPVAAEIRVLRAGEIVARATGSTLQLSHPVPGIYRVEVWLDGVPWILSSGIRVRP